MKPKAIIVSGYFNPLHQGHLELFNNAKAKGDILIVIVNNDKQRSIKGSLEFMLEDERLKIIKALAVTDQVFLSKDQDGTVCKSLEQVHEDLNGEYKLFFANGGDQKNETILENRMCEKLGISLIDGLGEKIQSSSWLLNKIN